MVLDTSAFVFLCSNKTEDECLERMLFGVTSARIKQEGLVKPGDNVFLFNFSASRLHGIFEATSENKLNIDRDAWEGKFPMQVRVKPLHRYESLGYDDIRYLIPPKSQFPKAILGEQEVIKLKQLFLEAKHLPEQESDFRTKYPATIRTEDWHLVRSYAELTIDNWLYHQQFCHAYERRLPGIGEEMYCDYALPLPISKEMVYIEYWGLEDQKYLERKKRKIACYEENKLTLIELTKKDLDNLDDVLPIKLRPYFPDKKFY